MFARTLYIIAFLAASLSVSAQTSVSEILQLVEQNNISLKAASAKKDAAKEEIMMESSLEDPEIGFDYLWGKPGTIGRRKDVNISQSFSLATVFGYRKRLAASQHELLELEYQQTCLNTRLEALDALVNLTYYNKLVQLYDERVAQDTQLLAACQRRLKAGDANKLEVNRARLTLAETEADAAQAATQRDIQLLELQTLCASAQVQYSATSYEPLSGFVTSSLRSVQEAQNAQQQLVAQNDVRVSRAQSLPSIKAGYMAELTDDEKWRGVTFGLTVPLWNNRHNIKRAKQQLKQVNSEVADAQFRLEQLTTAQQLRTQRLLDITQKMQQKLANASSTALLQKALDEGEISLTEYTAEVADLFQLKLKALESERDYQQAQMYLSFLGY